MKTLLLNSTLLATIGLSSLALAEDHHSLSVGYAYGKVNIIKMKGVNLKYRYEWDSPISAIGSFTYMKKNFPLPNDNNPIDNLDIDFNTKYYSLTVGPAYRVNEYVSLYALLGLNNGKLTITANNRTNNTTDSQSLRSRHMAYGAGVQINPIENLVLDLGYEGTSLRGNLGSTNKINGFNLGIGYRF